MTEPPIRSPLPPPPPPPPPPEGRSNIPMLYYGLIVVATAAIVLALYNFIVVKWCSDLTDHHGRERSNRSQRGASSSSHILNSVHLNIPGFKYKKDEDCGSECAVCLSVFEEGEELRRLPKCKHSFHAPCIDMWLYSHMDCPLCRSPVDQPPVALPQQRAVVVDQSEHSREGLLAQVTIV